MAGKIQDYSFWYNLLRPTVDNLFRWSMRRYRCLGRENIPTDGQIIYAPNHQNGLLDALAILSLDTKPKVFVSRADIHRNKRTAGILRWLKILPINRIRDGIDSVRHNDATIEQAINVLADGVPFCIMPEGTHRPKHSLLPLQKGIFRIALKAAQTHPESKTWIVPVGLEYGSWTEMWNSLTISIGQPIEVGAYCSAHQNQTEPQLILGLREELSSRMKQLILYLPDDEQYEEKWAKLQQDKPAPWSEPKSRLPRSIRAVLLALGLPLFLTAGALTCPIWLLLWGIRPKIKDIAFRNSAEFVITWLLLPLSLWLATPLWFYVKEYLYQIRRLRQ